MPVLEAPDALKKRYNSMRKAGGLDAFLNAVKKQHKIQQRLPAKPVKPPEKLGEPNERQAVQPREVEIAKAPPFNAIVGGAVLKYAKQLGPDEVYHLEALYKLNARGLHSRGLTAAYDGTRVDSSRGSYQHLNASERDAHELLTRIMRAMPIELKRITQELIFDEMPNRKAVELGAAVTGYDDDRRNIGAVVALLRVIAWITRDGLR